MTTNQYDRLSRWYDLLAGPWEAKPRSIGLDLLALREGERVVEIGCGTGQALKQLAQRVGPSGLACGLDLSAAMCQVAHSRVALGVTAVQTHVTRANALCLPYPDHLFDAAFVSNTLEIFEGPGIMRVLEECQRVLASKGRLCIVAMAIGTTDNLLSRAYQWSHNRWPSVVDCRPIAARTVVEQAGFTVSHATDVQMAGLPISIVLARPT